MTLNLIKSFISNAFNFPKKLEENAHQMAADNLGKNLRHANSWPEDVISFEWIGTEEDNQKKDGAPNSFKHVFEAKLRGYSYTLHVKIPPYKIDDLLNLKDNALFHQEVLSAWRSPEQNTYEAATRDEAPHQTI